MFDVVILTRNRPKILLKCLTTLQRSLISSKANLFHVHVIDNSSDNVAGHTADVCRMVEVNCSYTHADFSLGSQPKLRNLSQLWNQPYIIFIDDDAFVAENYCDNILRLVQDFPDQPILGTRIIQGPEYQLSGEQRSKHLPKFNAIRLATGTFNLIGNGFVFCDHCQGSSMVFKRSALDAVGWFNIQLCGGYASFEETEVQLRIRQHLNCKVLLSLDTYVVHGESPRDMGIPRDPFLDPQLAFSYGHNAVLCCKANGLNLRIAKVAVIFSTVLKLAKRIVSDMGLRAVPGALSLIRGGISV